MIDCPDPEQLLSSGSYDKCRFYINQVNATDSLDLQRMNADVEIVHALQISMPF